METGGEDCLNLLGCHSIEEKLKEYFDRFFKVVSVNQPFAAKGNGTISRYISDKCGVPCVQIEINSKLFLEQILSIEDIAIIIEGATSILGEISNEKNLVD